MKPNETRTAIGSFLAGIGLGGIIIHDSIIGYAIGLIASVSGAILIMGDVILLVREVQNERERKA